MMKVWAKATIVALGSLSSATAIAQSSPPPGSAQALPGRGEIEQTVPQNLPQRPSVRVDAGNAIPRGPCALDESDVRVNLTALTLINPDGTPLAPRLQELLAGSENGMLGDQPISVVCRVRDEINRKLSEAGYVALAQIPAQKISDGVLQIQIVTAHITEVRIIGDVGPFRKVLEQRIDLIRQLDPLNRHDAERILLLTGDIPGLDVQLALSSANGAPGDVIGTLTVDTRRFGLMANVQNYGSQQLGPWVGSVRGEAYGLTGMADRTYLSYSNAIDWKEVRVLQAGHDFAINDAGLRLGARGSLAWSRPDLTSLDLRSRSIIAGVELTMPIVRSVTRTLQGSAGFEILNQTATVHAGGTSLPLTRDRLRVLYARIDGDMRFLSSGREVVRLHGVLELRKGLDILNATKQGSFSGGAAPSRFDGNPTATVVRGELDAQIKPRGPFQLDLTGFGQWTKDPLLNLEEFSIGNYTHGRGYDPGSNGGDRVYGFSVEPRVSIPLRTDAVQVQASAFYDWLKVENLDTGTIEGARTFRSIGGGLRVILPQRMVLDLTYAKPLDKALETDAGKPKARFLVSLTAKLF